MVVMSAVLWIVSFIQIESQAGMVYSLHCVAKWLSIFVIIDTCDGKWQSMRDNLYISAFTISLITFAVTILLTIAVIISKRNLKQSDSVELVVSEV